MKNGIRSGFQRLVTATKCPFAARAQVALVRALANPSTLGRDIQRDATSVLAYLTGRRRAVTPDMVVVPIRSPELCKDLPSCASLLHTLVVALARAAAQSPVTIYQGIDSCDWDLVFSGVRVFVLVFAHFYPSDHIRFSHSKDTSYFCIQPDSSFDRHGVSADHEGRRELSEDVQRRFETAGVDYFPHLTRDSPKSYRFIKPLTPDAPPVIWWKSPLLLDLGTEAATAPPP